MADPDKRFYVPVGTGSEMHRAFQKTKRDWIKARADYMEVLLPMVEELMRRRSHVYSESGIGGTTMTIPELIDQFQQEYHEGIDQETARMVLGDMVADSFAMTSEREDGCTSYLLRD